LIHEYKRDYGHHRNVRDQYRDFDTLTDAIRSAMPEELTDRLTRHLFFGDIEDQPAEHPADILAKGLVSMKATKDGAEISIDRRGKGRLLRKKVASDDK